MIIALDSGPLGFILHPSADFREARECAAWFERLIARAERYCLPSIVEYETRRKLIHLDRVRSLRRLDELKLALDAIPITDSVLGAAAQLWADARKRGRPTAPPGAIDVDVILAAQVRALETTTSESLVVATTNTGDLASMGVDARNWRDIWA